MRSAQEGERRANLRYRVARLGRSLNCNLGHLHEMSFATIISNAANESQGILAQMQGMGVSAAGNFQYNGQVGTGVFGPAIIAEIPQPGGGYRRRAQVPLSVTRDQSFAFEAKTKLVRLSPSAVFPAITYVIDSIDTHDPVVWTLILVKAGA